MSGIVTHDGSTSGDEPVAAINVTSLIDIMFCLLIGFMVATPLANQEQVEIDVPKAPGIQITEEEFEYSVISVDAKGHVFIGSLPLDADKARWTEQLAANDKIKKDNMAFIQG
ncbi:MAG: biopolymer transporter ExbD, partial [Myxococcales bacterium]|nr:biopolymer transporter ExbD [Myxococcales bacterium]